MNIRAIETIVRENKSNDKVSCCGVHISQLWIASQSCDFSLQKTKIDVHETNKHALYFSKKGRDDYITWKLMHTRGAGLMSSMRCIQKTEIDVHETNKHALYFSKKGRDDYTTWKLMHTRGASLQV